MAPSPGALVTRSIRLVRPIGAGGMGSVWLADHGALQTQVAVKFLAEAAAAAPDAVARFHREATAAARLRSPHVVQVFDHGLLDGVTPFIVMELLDGQDLSQRLARAGALTLAETAQIVSQACRALARAHGLGIVHRDIKPSNLFVVDQDGEPFVKVLDFGIAKTAWPDLATTATGAVLGTPLYMSPEQVMSAKRVDHRSDLWSLGAVAYQCLSGRVPFHAESLGALCLAIARGEFAPLSQYRPDLPREVDAWIGRALAVDPEARFASAQEMAGALRALVARAGSDFVDAPTVPSKPAPGERLATNAASSPGAPTLGGASRTGASVAAARRGRSAWAIAFGVAGLAGALGATRLAHRAIPASAPPAVSAPVEPTSLASSTPPTAAPPRPVETAPEVVAAPPPTGSSGVVPHKPVVAGKRPPVVVPSSAPPASAPPLTDAPALKQRDRGF
jgi:serine/threonine-protein kinase